jgi:hypothetical protein
MMFVVCPPLTVTEPERFILVLKFCFKIDNKLVSCKLSIIYRSIRVLFMNARLGNMALNLNPSLAARKNA